MQPSGGRSSLSCPPAGSGFGSLDMLSGCSLHSDVMHSSNHLETILLRRCSVHAAGSPANAYSRSGFGGTSSDSRQIPGVEKIYHDRKRRNSIPVSSGSSTWRNTAASRRHPNSSRNPSEFPTTIAFERQGDDSLDTIRLAKACGMTLDTFPTANNHLFPFNAGRPSKCDIAVRMSPFFSSDQHESDAANPVRTEQSESSAYERGRPRPQSLFERSSCHDDHTALVGCLLPTSPTYPYFARRSSSSTRSDQKVPPLPFAPPLDPLQQLARVDNLLSLHQTSFFNDPKGPVMAEDLIDVPQLMREHDLDTQQEVFDREVEHDDNVMTFSEKFAGGQGNADQRSGLRSPMYLINTGEADYHVFGQPLYVTRSYASCVSSMAGYQHDLPIVVNACVEELYRTGMTESGLFRSPPDAARHKQLIELFDNGPFFGRSETLTKERTEDICALLRSYIDRLPHPLWHESLFDPMMRLCVSSSVFGDLPLSEESENKDRNEGLVTGYRMTQTRPTSLFVHGTPSAADVDNLHVRSSSLGDITAFAICRPSSALSTVAHNEINVIKERPQVFLARAFFRLLPRMHLAVLAYLCAFFSQLPLCSHNQLTIEDIARFFAVPLFLGKMSDGVLMTSDAQTKRKQEARMIMVWILRRWSQISEGLFDAEATDSPGGSEDGLLSPSSSDDSESVQTFASDRIRPANDNSSGVDPGAESSTIVPLPEGQSSVEDDADVTERKDHVEQDIAELRRTFLNVRARLETR